MPLTESGFLPPIDRLARDFSTTREAFVKHLQNYFPNDWQDFAESNLGTAIFELVAFGIDNLSFYLDRVTNEMFLPTVTQRQNAINLVNLIGYVPRTAAAALAPLRATLESQASEVVIPAFNIIQDKNGNAWEFLENITIPSGRSDTGNIVVSDELLGTGDGTTTSFSFITDNENITATETTTLVVTIDAVQYSIEAASDGNIVLPFGGSGFIDYETGEITLSFAANREPDNSTNITLSYTYSQKVTVYQGRTRSENFSSTGLPSQEFTLTATPVLLSAIIEDEVVTPNPNRFEVWIGDPGAPFGNGTGVQWTRVDSLISASPTEEVYELRIDEQDRVIVIFGDNLAGSIPPEGADNITIIYRTGGGRIGNINVGDIDTQVTGSTGFFGVNVNITNPDKGSGGAARESLDEIRVNAPAFLRTNDTATTENDYDTLSLFSRGGQGAIVRAKSRLTPSTPISTKTVHTNEVLDTVPISTPLEYFLRLPSTPAVVDTIVVQYQVPAGTVTATANDLGSGLAELVVSSGSPSGTLDGGNTRLRYDVQDVEDDVPAIFVGDGSTFDFNSILTKPPVFPGSVIFRYTIGGTDYVGIDDGNGALVGTHVNSLLSTINYGSGATRVVFGTRASLTSGAAEPYDLDSLNSGGAVDLVFSVDGAADTTITFVSGDFSNYAAATAQEVAAKINATVAGLADGTTGRVVLTSSTIGASSSLQVKAASVNPDANQELLFSTSTVTGTENPPDSASVISFDYQSAFRLVLLTAPESGTDITISMESGPTEKEFPTNNIEIYTWSAGPDNELTTPGVALRDSLKSFLDKRRVLGTSIEILPGNIVRTSYHLEITFDAAISQTETQTKIVQAIESLFADPVQVKAGQDVPVAAVIDAIYPLEGVIKPTVEEVAIRVPVGIGNGSKAIFKPSPTEMPGQFVSSGKLPGKASPSNSVKVYLNSTQVGSGSSGDPSVQIGTVTGSGFSMLGGSFFNVDTGDFDLRFSPAPQINQVVYIEYRLDDEEGGMKLWNVNANPWEVAVLAEIHINGIQVR